MAPNQYRHIPCIPYIRFFEQYTLHYLEQHTSDELLLNVSIATLRYGVGALREAPPPAREVATPVQDAEYVREVVYPRWQEVLNEPERLNLDWKKALQTGPARAPRAPRRTKPLRFDSPTPPQLPGGGKWQRRMDTFQRALGVVETTLRAAGTLAALLNDWRAERRRRELLDAQRELLQAALSQTLAGAGEALHLAGEPGFVAGYLAEHVGDNEDDEDAETLVK